MKLTIEIDDDAFAHAVDIKVGKAISELAESAIAGKVDEIINKKVERKIESVMPIVFQEAQEAMQKAFIKSIGTGAKKKKKKSTK